MSAEYRQKLVNWLTSMLVLLTIVFANALYGWFTRLRYLVPIDEPSNIDLYLLFAGPLEGFAIYFVVLWFWHISDFIQQERWTNRWLGLLTSYRLLITLLLLIGASTLFIQSGWLDDLGCPEINNPPGVFTFDGCGAWTPWWKEMIGVVLVLSLLFSAFSKVLAVLASYTIRLSQKALSLLQSDDKVSP